MRASLPLARRTDLNSTAVYLRAMKNMRTVAQASLDMARATALTPSFRATFASTCHPEKHIC